MIRINLLPVRAARRREAVQRHLVLFAAGLAAIVAVGVITYGADRSRLGEIERANSALSSDIADLKKVIGEVDEYKLEEQRLAQKLGVIEDLRAKKTGPVRMLDRVASDIPDKLWLTELTEKDQKVTLKGVSINNEVIATFMNKMEDSIYFSDVFLVSIQARDEGDLKLKEFTVTSQLSVPGGNTGEGS